MLSCFVRGCSERPAPRDKADDTDAKPRALALSGDLFLEENVLGPSSAAGKAARALLEGIDRATVREAVTVDYPLEASVFPPEIVAPTFLWHDADEHATRWVVEIAFEDVPHRITALTTGKRPAPAIDERCRTKSNVYEEPPYQASAKGWTPRADVWELMKRHAVKAPARVTVFGVTDDDALCIVSRGSTTFTTSTDPVGAQIFYRDVPLMPSETKDGIIKPLKETALPMIKWRLRDLSKPEAPIVMEHLPTCANCHTFSRDGKTLAMDMDGPDGDKGAHVLKAISREMVIRDGDVFTWNSYREGRERFEAHQSFGMFPQISPDGRYIVSTVYESVFVQNYMDYRFLQTFYPTRGILAIYTRATGEIHRLPGADDPDYVQSNGTWRPDGEEIVFIRARTRPNYGKGPRARYANDPKETQIRYDLYRVPFNDGKGGVAVPVEGASFNGMSNSFPRFSPDGKWIVFVGCRNGLLMRPDSRLCIIAAGGGTARALACNTRRMNSWHIWSPNSRWLVFSSKCNTPYTQMFLTHIDDEGRSSPAILIPNSTAANRAVNLPEFAAIPPGGLVNITTPAVEYRRHLDLGKKHMKAGRLAEAVAELRKSIDMKGDYPDSHVTLADMLTRYGKPDEALKHYERAIEIEPRFFTAHNNLAVALAQIGRFDDAVKHFTIALDIQPRSFRTWNMLGMALNRQGKHEEALRHFRRAVTLAPGDVDAHVNLGETLSHLGKPAEAATQFERAVAIDPSSDAAWYVWGTVLASQGREAEAVERFRKAIAANARNVFAHNRLARILATHPDAKVRDGAEATRLATVACERTSQRNPYFLDTLAAAYAETGRFTDAVRTAEKALALARAAGSSDLADDVAGHLARFLKQQPLRGPN